MHLRLLFLRDVDKKLKKKIEFIPQVVPSNEKITTRRLMQLLESSLSVREV